ncbi:MAG: hypothetical protein Q7K42_05310 [Candidatus Diapherotrites archaeon]|nr:hypothetical protein [Candidatus Diapherotrites archaeon]
MGKKQINMKGLRAIKKELIKDGYLNSNGDVTKKGIEFAKAARLEGSPDSIILHVARRTATLQGPGESLVGAVFPKTNPPKPKEPWHKNLYKKAWNFIRRK